MDAVLNVLASVACVLVGVGWLFWAFGLDAWRAWSGRKDIARAAAARGWSYRGRDKQLRTWLDYPPFDRKDIAQYSKVVEGTHRGLRLWLFSFRLADDSSDHHYAVAALGPVVPAAPAVRVFPQAAYLGLRWPRRRSLPRGEPIIDVPAADDGYLVISSAPAVADRLQRRVIELLRPYPTLSFGLEAGAVLLIEEVGDAHFVLNADAILPLLDALAAVVAEVLAPAEPR